LIVDWSRLMLGWWISLSTQTPQERDTPPQEVRCAAILAHWEGGLGGRDKSMVAAGQSKPLCANG
jgi:hypothetical protein